MQIAPGFESSDWTALRLDGPDSATDWERAIEIFKTKIYGRFIDPADLLISVDAAKSPTERRFGFAVLAIDCLLVETLGAFVQGLEDTDGKSKATFAKFLVSQPGFGAHFTQERAERFYKDFRCGILHQAEVGGDSKIWSVGDLIRDGGGRLTVNRTKFHDQLKVELENYVEDLRDPHNTDLRANFRKKMDFICR